MPEPVELIIKVENREAIQNIKNQQKSVQQLKQEIDNLYKANKKGFSSVEGIKEYEKKMADLKKQLAAVTVEEQKMSKATEGVNTATEKAGRSGGSMIKSLGNWALGFATVSAAVSVFKKVIESTDTLADKFKATLNGWKEGFVAMARAVANNDFKDFFKNVRDAVTEGQRFVQTQESIEDSSRAAKIQIAKNKTELIDLRIAQQNSNLTRTQQIELGEKAIKLLKENSKLELDIAASTLQNDLKNAASKAHTSEFIVSAYLKQDEALMKHIAIGEKYNQLQKELANTTRVVSTGTSSVTVVDEAAAKAIRDKIALLGPEADAYGKLAIGLGNILDVQKDKITSDYEAVESAKQAARNLRVENALNADLAADAKKINEEKLKGQKDYQKYSLELLDKYDKSQIESLEGKPKLEAQRKFAIQQIKELRDQLASLGPLSEEQKQMLQTLVDNIWKQYYEDLSNVAKTTRATPAQQEAISKALLGNIDELPGLQKMTQNTIENTKKQLEENKANEEFSVWRLLGIDPDDEEGKQIIDAINNISSQVQDSLEKSLAMRVENAQRTRELYDTQISELQNEIELEAQLYEEGYANNLRGKQLELAELKKQRDKALKDEEKAVRQEQLLAKITQTTNILSGVSDIIKTYSKIPVLGLILAAAAIASLFAIWAKAKTTVSTAILASGGSGTDKGLITGKRHSEGGERFLDHVEVERGEAFGVLSRPATERYGKVFHEMVSSFNKNEMPSFVAPAVTNSVRVDNNGPNSRLDKVIKEQRRLNESIMSQSQIYNAGNKRVIKRGNKIRIVG